MSPAIRGAQDALHRRGVELAEVLAGFRSVPLAGDGAELDVDAVAEHRLACSADRGRLGGNLDQAAVAALADRGAERKPNTRLPPCQPPALRIRSFAFFCRSIMCSTSCCCTAAMIRASIRP